MNEAKMTELTQAEDMAYFRADLCLYSPESYSMDEKKEICNDMMSTSKAALGAQPDEVEQGERQLALAVTLLGYPSHLFRTQAVGSASWQVCSPPSISFNVESIINVRANSKKSFGGVLMFESNAWGMANVSKGERSRTASIEFMSTPSEIMVRNKTNHSTYEVSA